MDIREIRRNNLKKLMDAEYGIGARGAQSRLAEKLDKPQNFISRCLADPKRPGAKTIGEDFAREIERAFRLETYSLDKPAGEYGLRASEKLEVAEDGGIYKAPSGVMAGIPLFASGPMVSAIASAITAAPRAGAGQELAMDDGGALIARIRRAHAEIASVTREKAESLARSIVGEVEHADQVLILLDAILEAALLRAIDLEEIQAITTLVKKRRNEKVHGVSPAPKEKQNDLR